MTAETIKACCADLYASDWVPVLLGDSFHPGGLALTERLGQLLGLDSRSRVLDLAAGRGTSAVHLARTFGCNVVGVDFSETNIARAREATKQAGVSDRVQFVHADAERLTGLTSSSFDVVLCECAYCTFPDKHAAGLEIRRVLAPGGRFGLSDLTRNGGLPPELDGLFGWIACLADAQPAANYVDMLRAVGLTVDHIEAHDQALGELVDQIRGRLLGLEVLAKLQQLELRNMDFQLAKRMARMAAEAIEVGTLGYTLIVASRPADASPQRRA